MRDYLSHLPYIEIVASEDVKCLHEKEKTYQGSWRRNGGSHAWQMIKRKIDRLLTMLAPLNESDITNLRDTAAAIREGQALPGSPDATADLILKALAGEDIFVQLEKDISGADGTVLAEVRDLRRYLMLVEARMQAEVVAEIRKGGMTHVNQLVDKVPTREYYKPKVDVGEGCEANGPHGEGCCGTGTAGKSPEPPLPVPVSDSSRHAERAPSWHRCRVKQQDGSWKVRPL